MILKGRLQSITGMGEKREGRRIIMNGGKSIKALREKRF